jgi:diaminohydroxyphosphoribosylaminopyrimidine deaminase/5-amino-6-(5-phosphoribosylamino)uracil reductase
MTTQPEQFMQKALELARMGLGRTAPNPPVGAVLVRDGRIVGEGFHPAAGEPHAEIFALREAGTLARGADLYVTLEPCCHTGRTGPCTEAIISAGVAKVCVGTRDPNPRVAGRGLTRLQGAGVPVSEGLCEADCRSLIAPFAKHVQSGLPYVVYKAAMTLDGQTAAAGGDSRWISCEQSRELVHQLRNQVDAIMVGSGTVNADNPKLTTRLPKPGRDPVRIVLDGSLSTSPQADVYRQSSDAGTILVTASEHAAEKIKPFRASGVEVVQVRRQEEGLDLLAAMTELGSRDLQYVLLEGGSRLAAAMLKTELVDRMMIFVAPLLIGGEGRSLFAGQGVTRLSSAYRLKQLQSRQLGCDVLLEGEVQYVHRPD